jgi:hypothetical protein
MLASVSDSGSNNFTMAREMQRQLKEEGYKSDHSLQWDPKSMSIRCFCHKMGLIVKAGIDALGMKPRRVRHDTLGRFPPVGVMAVIDEEDEEVVDETEGSGCNDAETESDDDESDDDDIISNHSSDSNKSKADSDRDDFEDIEQQDEPQNYKNRKAAYLLGDTYMKQLTNDVS